MTSLYDFIVTVENRYNNKVDVDGKELIVNTEISERDHIFVNQIGTVTGCPRNFTSDIQKGDKVLLNHNVFRRWYDMRGEEKNCRAYLFGDLYTVQPEQIYGYWSGGSFRALPAWTFVRPIEQDGSWSTSGEVEARGVVEYSDRFQRGSLVGYVPNMDVEFNIEGQKLYRILNKFINVEFEGENKNINQVVGASSD